jgi:tetratricopeptide (TPR) repeat protein
MNRSQACELASQYLNEAQQHPSSLMHIVATYIHLNWLNFDISFTEAARALALDPNDPEASVAMAWVMTTTGRPQAALEFMQTAMRLNPSYPSRYSLVRGLALFSSGALAEAARVLEEAIERSPTAIELAPPLAATYAQLGRRAEARDMLLRWKPDASQEELSNIPLDYPYTYRWSADGQEALDRLTDGMMIAALPLDVTVPELADALQRGGPFERAHAAKTLARFGPQAADAVPALVRALDGPSPVVRSAAITALGRIGPKAKTAVPALAGIQDAQLRPLAKGAVAQIEGR